MYILYAYITVKARAGYHVQLLNLTDLMVGRNGHSRKEKKDVIKSGKDPPVASVSQDLCYAVISAKSYRPGETRNFIHPPPPVNTSKACFYLYVLWFNRLVDSARSDC